MPWGSKVAPELATKVTTSPKATGTSMLMQMLEAGGVPVLTDRLRQPAQRAAHFLRERQAVARAGGELRALGIARDEHRLLRVRAPRAAQRRKDVAGGDEAGVHAHRPDRQSVGHVVRVQQVGFEAARSGVAEQAGKSRGAGRHGAP